jgi:flagellar L-ring protein precursor FlgH
MKNILFLSTVTILFTTFFSACTAKLTEPEIEFEPPAYVEQMPAKEEKKDFGSTGSLFGKGDNPLFSDHKAMHVNDIVTVVISETAKSSNSGSKQLTESDTSNLGGGIFSSTGVANGSVNSAIGKANGFTDIGFTSKSDNSYKG